VAFDLNGTLTAITPRKLDGKSERRWHAGDQRSRPAADALSAGSPAAIDVAGHVDGHADQGAARIRQRRDKRGIEDIMVDSSVCTHRKKNKE
jgi:hypothetical protein